MPTFVDALGSNGPFVRVEVGVSQPHRLKLFAARRPIPQSLSLTALIDTGAGLTCIDPKVIRRLQIQPKGGLRPVNAPGLGGLTFPQTYEVGVTILHPSGNPADHLIIPNTDVADVSLGVLSIDVLLGRDVLALCDFNYLGRSGTFALSY
jgi:hypothetical protein